MALFVEIHETHEKKKIETSTRFQAHKYSYSFVKNDDVFLEKKKTIIMKTTPMKTDRCVSSCELESVSKSTLLYNGH